MLKWKSNNSHCQNKFTIYWDWPFLNDYRRKYELISEFIYFKMIKPKLLQTRNAPNSICHLKLPTTHRWGITAMPDWSFCKVSEPFQNRLSDSCHSLDSLANWFNEKNLGNFYITKVILKWLENSVKNIVESSENCPGEEMEETLCSYAKGDPCAKGNLVKQK